MARSLLALRGIDAEATDVVSAGTGPLDYVSLFSKEDQLVVLGASAEGVAMLTAIREAEQALQQARIAASAPFKSELQDAIATFLEKNGDFLWEGQHYTFAEAVSERSALYYEGKKNAGRSSLRTTKMASYTKMNQERLLPKEDLELLASLENYLAPFNGFPAGHLIAAAPSSKVVTL
jgi:hypothetical protein